MYSKNDKNSTQVLRKYGDTTTISVVLRNGSSYQVVFYTTNKKKTISFKQNETEAHRVAKAIAYDLDLGNLDVTDLQDLSSEQIKLLYQQDKSQTKLTLIESIKDTTDTRNLKTIWLDYINQVKHTKSSNTLREYQETTNFLNKFNFNDLLLSNISNLGKISLTLKTSLNKSYGLSSLQKRFKNLTTALNYFKIDTVSLSEQLPKVQKSKIAYYKPDEIKAILEAFKHFQQNKYDTTEKGSRYYYPYTLFCALTGVRPSEAIALTFHDIKISQGKVQVTINKAFSNGNLRKSTKTNKIRVIPLNTTLSKFMIDYCQEFSYKSDDNLVFPSVQGVYITQSEYNRDHFKPIVEELAKQGKVEKYLSSYKLRHSFATNMLRQGVDIATVAGLLGDNIQTVIDNYIGSDYENANLPDIY